MMSNISFKNNFSFKKFKNGVSSIYIEKNVCLSVLYAFGHGTTKCNEILHTIPFRPGEGYRVVFDPKFSSQGGVYPPYSWICYCKYLFPEICTCDCYSMIRGGKSIPTKRNVCLFAVFGPCDS